ncbi:MAG TPA: peptidylprolyl isomerase [Candidatus Angelobacter sp.]|nr:peptidylprolyl isomerase [Candidatus Angelobacter sp.]
MLRLFLIFLLVITGAAWSQVNSQERSSAQSTSVGPKSTVSLSEAVITVPGVCDASDSSPKPSSSQPPAGVDSNDASPSSCMTVITREQFENLLSGLGEEGQLLRKDQTKALAGAYADFLVFAAAARKEGIEENPQFKEFLRYQYLRMLAGIYRHSLEEKYKTATPEDISAYYQQHIGDFEEIGLRRLMIPKNNLGAKDKEEYKKKAPQLAQEMRDRIVKGEDTDDLQKEAYKTLELKIVPPETQIGKRRRTALVPEEADELFSLKSGETSKVELENSSYAIYKIDSKRTLPMDQVRDEIARLVSKERVSSAFKAVTANVQPKLNPKYFEPNPSPSASAPEPHMDSPQTKTKP